MKYKANEQYTIDYDSPHSPRVYDILRGMSSDIQQLKNTQYEFQHETQHELNAIKQRLDKVESDTAELKQDVAVLKSDVADLKEDMKLVKQDLRDIHGEVKGLSGQIAGMQTRIGWWLAVTGAAIALMEYFKG